MTSLVPFDFRCVGQLTALSLRCAPLHVSLPPTWRSTAEPVPFSEDGRRPAAPALVSSPLLPLHDGPDASDATGGGQVATPAPESSTSAGTPPLETDRSLAVSPPSSSSHGTAGTAGPSAPLSAAVASGTATHALHGSSRVVSLYEPSLSIETFFELRPVHQEAGEDGELEMSSGCAVSGPRGTKKAAASAAAVAGGNSSDKADRKAVSALPRSSTLPSPVVYTSEVVRGSTHPNWSPVPAHALQPYATHTQIVISVFYSGSCVQQAWALGHASREAKASPSPPPSDVCVLRCHVDLRCCYYLGVTLEEADGALSRLLRAEEQRAASRPRLPQPILLLRCLDGVFVPTACFAQWLTPVAATVAEWQATRTRTFCPAPAAADFQCTSPSPSSLHAIAGRNSLAALAAEQAAAACREVPWSRTPSSIGWRYPVSAAPDARHPQQPHLRMTMGDVKAATHATLAWQWLVEALEERKAALSSELDAAASAQPSARAVAAQCAAMRVRLSAARESLTLTTLELETMRERVERRQRRLLRDEEAVAAVRSYESHLVAPETVSALREEARAEEAERAALRAQLARGRQQRVRELCLVYTITLSSQYASHTCVKAGDAKDRINGAALPISFARRTAADSSSHLVASTADDMHEEAVALGHACHLLLVLSMLYCCPLPYPILLGGCQSHVLASPNLDPVAAYAAPYAATGARKYALSCGRVAERPLMMAGVQLLLYDGAVIAAAMGKPERRIAGCADRLGALLDLLLHDAE